VQVRFFENRERRRIAYVDEGRGPLVALPAWWVSHLEREAETAPYARFFARLAERFRVVRYDRVGVGLSDRARDAWTLDSELADFEALLDHLGARRAHLLGVSCGGPIALAFAARHPERVDKIALYGSFVDGAQLSPKDVQRALVALVRASWGLGSSALADLFCAGADAATHQDFKALQREGADAETAARLLELTYALDARPFVADVRAPVLVLHRKSDRAIRWDAGRSLAASLPGAALTTLEGACHMPWHGDADAVLRALAAFFDDAPARATTVESAAELRRDGEVWTIRFAGRQVLLKDGKGLADLARLLVEPGKEIHVFDLVGAAAGERRDGARGDVALDRTALVSIRERLEAIDEGLAEAEAHADEGRRRKLSAEREALLRRLSADVGLGGRGRKLNDPVERARKAVTARLRDTIRRIRTVHTPLGEHLETAVVTGVRCAYRPPGGVQWRIPPDVF